MDQQNYFGVPNCEFRIPLRKRIGLQVRKIYYQSEPFWVVKLPHDLEFYYFNEHEYAILEKLDGEISYRQIQDQFNLSHCPFRLRHRDITRILIEFVKKSVVEPTGSSVGAGMHIHSREKRRQKLVKQLTNILAIKWKGLDPELFLELSQPYVNWFFSKTVVFFNLFFLFSVLCWLGFHQDEFYSRLPDLWDFAKSENWISMGVAVGICKLCHELGHAFALKKFNGECHEIGVMIFFFVPTLYCNTSDSWMLANKWHRMAIAAAGVYVESFIFSIASVIWWTSSVGDVQSICANLMFVVSISAIITNGNPLLRYDGYFVLSDWLEIPNLAQKSSKEIQRLFLHYCCGDRRKIDVWTSTFNKRIYLSYGIAAFCFRILLMVTVSLLMIGFFQPIGLSSIGVALAMFSLLTIFFKPFNSIFEHLKEPGNWQQMNRKHMAITSLVAGIGVATIVLFPLPYWVPADCSVSLVGETSVYTMENGKIEEIFVLPGTHVRTGDPIIRLSNDELEKQLIELDSQLRQTNFSISMNFRSLKYLTLQNGNKQQHRIGANSINIKPSLLELIAKRKMLCKERAALLKRLSHLTVRAPQSGIVYGVTIGKHVDETRVSVLNELNGNPLDRIHRFAILEKGTEICMVASEEKFELTLAIAQKYSRLICVGQRTKSMVASSSIRMFGEITSVARIESYFDELPRQITLDSQSAAVSQAKPTANEDSRKNVRYKDGQSLTSTLIQAKSSYLAKEPFLIHGSKGKAFIQVGYRTVGQRLQNKINEVFQLHL